MNIVGAAQSCAVAGITQLSHHREKSIESMKDFCRISLNKDPKRPNQSFTFDTGKKFKNLYAHYIFCAGDEAYYSGAYGTKFAEFIQANNLGSVVTLPKVYNTKHHPSTTCQVWLWQPDQDAMERWWEQNGYEPPVEEKKADDKPVDA